MLLLGGVTMFVGGVCALSERDLKKVVAFSTLSQLGFLMVILSSYSFSTGFFHLITHAFFKSMLFIRVGYLILSRAHNQQGIRMSGASLTLRVIAWVRLLSMRGCLFFGGFFSKHSVLGGAQLTNVSTVLTLVLVLGRILTCAYRARLGNSLLKSRKILTSFPQQTLLFVAVLLGGAIVPKFLLFETRLVRNESGILSFLFLIWL